MKRRTTWPFGRPEEIRTEIRRLCREMGKGGGYILKLAKSIQPETPIENAVAAFETFIEQDGAEPLPRRTHAAACTRA